jgi:hypothetical protein
VLLTAHTGNPSTQEAEAGGSQAQAQPELQKKVDNPAFVRTCFSWTDQHLCGSIPMSVLTVPGSQHPTKILTHKRHRVHGEVITPMKAGEPTELNCKPSGQPLPLSIQDASGLGQQHP